MDCTSIKMSYAGMKCAVMNQLEEKQYDEDQIRHITHLAMIRYVIAGMELRNAIYIAEQIATSEMEENLCQ